MGSQKGLVKPMANRHMWESGCELWLRKQPRLRAGDVLLPALPSSGLPEP